MPICLAECTYHYDIDFLTARTISLQVGELLSDFIHLPYIGTPQGSVFSLLLFNLAIPNMSKKFNSVPGLRYSLYADNIAI